MKEEKMVKKAIIGRTLAAMIVSLMEATLCGDVLASEHDLVAAEHEPLEAIPCNK